MTARYIRKYGIINLDEISICPDCYVLNLMNIQIMGVNFYLGMIGKEYLLILESLMEIKPSTDAGAIQNLKDVIERLNLYYEKTMSNISHEVSHSLHFGLSDDFMLGVKTGLLINDRIYLQDIALINHIAYLMNVMKKGGDALDGLINNLKYFVSNVYKISDLIEEELVVYIPHRALWHQYFPEVGKKYVQFKESNIYSIITQGLNTAYGTKLPPYSIDGIVASSLLGVPPITDDMRVLYGLEYIETSLMTENIEGFDSFYFEELKSMKRELKLVERAHISDAVRSLTAEQILELQKDFKPEKINKALLKLDIDKIDEIVSGIFDGLETPSMRRRLAISAFDGLSLLGASIFVSLPPFVAVLAPLVATIDFAKGIVEYLYDLKDQSREVYEALFKKHIRLLKKEHKEILKIVSTARSKAKKNMHKPTGRFKKFLHDIL